MNRSNIHPAVAAGIPAHHGGGALMGFGEHSAASPAAAKSLFGALSAAAPSPLAPSFEANLSMNEALARTRARELMQSYARDKQRSYALEAEVSRTNADNDELALLASTLQRQVADLQAAAVQREEAFATERRAFEATFASVQQELQRTAALSAHQTSDLMAQLRLREEECAHAQAGLVTANEENAKLRREAASRNNNNNGANGGLAAEGSGLQRAQSRAVELARRLLDAERGRRAAEDALIEDRRHHHMALHTIEQLRQQLAAAEGRVEAERGRREAEGQQLRHQLEHVREEYDQREDAYKRVLLAGGGGGGADRSDADSSTANATNGSKSGSAKDLALLCSTLEARTQSQQEHIDFLTEQSEKGTARLQEAIKELQAEKARRVEEATKAQETIRGLKDDGTRKELMAARREKERTVAALADLTGLYQESLERFASSSSSATAGGGTEYAGLVGDERRTSAAAAISSSAFVARTLTDINTSLRQILATCTAAASSADGDDVRRLMELMTAHMATGGSGAAVGRVISDGGGVGAADGFTGSSSSAGAKGSLATIEHKRQLEALQALLTESEAAAAAAEERSLEKERLMRAQMEQLVAHTQRLQRQTELDADELEGARHQLEMAEANAAARLSALRRDCARSIESLYNALKQIESEHRALLQRRGGPSFGPGGPMAAHAAAEANLGERIGAALREQEALLAEWGSDGQQHDGGSRHNQPHHPHQPHHTHSGRDGAYAAHRGDAGDVANTSVPPFDEDEFNPHSGRHYDPSHHEGR